MFPLCLIASHISSSWILLHYSGKFEKLTCPGPDRCKFPAKPGINCYNAVADYYMGPPNTFMNIHYTNNSRFALQDGCQP
uniref:X8 domain-containing protein n=1 Tax=Heterorhabditis bacteriophora TaxID=37862 RepID=A0A1I7XGV7_HETBA